MEELFENKTRCTKKTYETFLRDYQEEFARTENFFMLYYIIFFGFCMIMAFLNKEILLGFLLLAGLIIYLWFKIIRPVKKVEKTRKSPKLSGDLINTYKFYKRYFTVKNKEGKTQQFYFKMYRTVETQEYYYIFISREYAFIISKDGFTKGESQEFSKFIKKKMFNKYRNRTNRNAKKINKENY